MSAEFDPSAEAGEVSALPEAEIAAVLRSLDRRRRDGLLTPAERELLEREAERLAAELARRGAGG